MWTGHIPHPSMWVLLNSGVMQGDKAIESGLVGLLMNSKGRIVLDLAVVGRDTRSKDTIMESIFNEIREVLLPHYRAFIEDNATAFPNWEMDCSLGVACPISGWRAINLIMDCLRPCCLGAHDGVRHSLHAGCIFFKDDRCEFRISLFGMVVYDEEMVVAPNRFDRVTVEQALIEAKRILEYVPAGIRILEADTMDVATRLEMRGW